MSVQAISRFFDLPLNEWQPSEIPVPAQPLHFDLDCRGKSMQQCINEAIWYSYLVNDDDGRLRFSPETFEKQRGEYPVRREFTAFTIDLRNAYAGTYECLCALGFSIN